MLWINPLDSGLNVSAINNRMKRVVIIGAGPCGLVALKEMLAAGHDAVLCERSAKLGGTFASAAMYPDLHLTISNWAMGFSDFPDTERLCYPSAKHYLGYLQRYARHFDLGRHINYGSEVHSAALASDGTWDILIQQIGEEKTMSIKADAVIVATGANQLAKSAPPELAGFGGRVIHSLEYNEAFKTEVAEKNLRVLVVGGGESGADISADLGELSRNVTVWLRRHNCIGPRYLNERKEMDQVKANKTQDFPANGFLEAATTNRMSAAQNVYAYGFFRRLLWNTTVLNRALCRMCLGSTKSAFLMNDQATYVTKNQRMCEALGEGKIDAIVAPTMLTRNRTCEFHESDGTRQIREFDVVVLCTGYKTTFPWLQVKDFDSNPRSWFLHCFPKDLGHCLFFVGYARPHQGGIPAMAEMLSRYVALVLRGERTLPLDYSDRALRDAEAERQYYFMSPNLNSLVDYNAFLESVARRISCEPRLPVFSILMFNVHMLAILLLLLRISFFSAQWVGAVLWSVTMASFFLYDNGLLIKWWYYPNWPVWYRQRGPGAVPSLLNDTLHRVDLWKATAITRGFVLMILWSVPTYYAQRLLSIVLFLPQIVLTRIGIPFPKAWGGLLRPKLFVLHSNEWRFSDLFLP